MWQGIKCIIAHNRGPPPKRDKKVMKWPGGRRVRPNETRGGEEGVFAVVASKGQLRGCCRGAAATEVLVGPAAEAAGSCSESLPKQAC